MRATSLKFRKSDVLALIKQKHGSIDNFISAWSSLISAGKIRAGVAKDRATLYRWLDKGFPAQVENVLSFCGALDVDFVCLLDISSETLKGSFSRIRQSLQIGTNLVPAAKTLVEIYRPGPHWPSEALAVNYYGRKWHTTVFSHDPNLIANVYAAISLTISKSVGIDHPTAFHIAYRRQGALDEMWRPYGCVVRDGNQTRLISDSGEFQQIADNNDVRRVRVETYFGAGPALFKLASLHPFRIKLEVPSNATGIVRFHG